MSSEGEALSEVEHNLPEAAAGHEVESASENLHPEDMLETTEPNAMTEVQSLFDTYAENKVVAPVDLIQPATATTIIDGNHSVDHVSVESATFTPFRASFTGPLPNAKVLVPLYIYPISPETWTPLYQA